MVCLIPNIGDPLQRQKCARKSDNNRGAIFLSQKATATWPMHILRLPARSVDVSVATSLRGLILLTIETRQSFMAR